MAQFGLFKPFDIDNGELDGLTAQQIFVLGYELAEIEALLRQAPAFRKPVHADNQHRILRFCADAGRSHRLAWMPGDPSESWMILSVDALDDGAEVA